MATELGSIINNTLFKATTDGLSGEYLVKVVNGAFTYSQAPVEPVEVYSELISTGGPGLVLTAGDIALDASYVPLVTTGMWSSGTTKNCTPSTATVSIVVGTNGVYRVSSFVSISSSVAATKFSFKYKVNEGLVSSRRLVTSAKDVADTNNVSGTGLIQLLAGDSVSFCIAADKSCTATVTSAGLIVHKIDEV